MTFTSNFKINFSKRFIQRTIYLFAFIAYLILWTLNKDYQILSQKSSLGLSYWIIDLIIIIPLLFQFIFNNKIGWTFILLLLCIHFFLALIRVKRIDDGDFMKTILIVILYIVPFALMYYLYPKQTDK